MLTHQEFKDIVKTQIQKQGVELSDDTLTSILGKFGTEGFIREINTSIALAKGHKRTEIKKKHFNRIKKIVGSYCMNIKKFAKGKTLDVQNVLTAIESHSQNPTKALKTLMDRCPDGVKIFPFCPNEKATSQKKEAA